MRNRSLRLCGLLVLLLLSGCAARRDNYRGEYFVVGADREVRVLRTGEAAPVDGVLVPWGTWLELRRLMKQEIERLEQEGQP